MIVNAGSAAAPPESAAARAYHHAKERLLDGRFAAGVLLSENEIARELGISRTPVREAFLQLEAEGLLQLYPRRGALVTPISPSEHDDVLEARMLIEAHCVARVADQGPALAEVLRESIADQERALDDRGPRFIVADREFHRAIVAAHGNQVLTRQYDALRDRQQRIAATAVAGDRDRIMQFIVEHRAIAAAIDERNSAAALQLITVHLRRAHELARGRRR